jgi:hypothetical protein
VDSFPSESNFNASSLRHHIFARFQWIEDFLGVKGLANYHGTGAFNVTKYPTWDSLLLDMIVQKNGAFSLPCQRQKIQTTRVLISVSPHVIF